MENFSTLHFHITSRCSCRCKHCSADAGPHQSNGDLRLEDIERMLYQAKDFGAVFFDISGGDPLKLEKEFVLETIRLAVRSGLSPSISTNGENLSSEYVEDMTSVGLEKIKFSLYGVIPETHDDFTRVRGSFERVIKGIKLSKHAGIEVWVNSVITPRNLQEFQGLPSLLEPWNVDLVQLTSIVPCGRGEVAYDYQFSEDELERAIEILEDFLSEMNYAFTTTLFPDPHRPPFDERHCDYFHDRLVVDPRGNIIPCCLLPSDLQHHLGNVREGLSEACSDQRIQENWVFSWLAKGHEEMRRELNYGRVSHNLCETCIDMLYRLHNRLD